MDHAAAVLTKLSLFLYSSFVEGKDSFFFLSEISLLIFFYNNVYLQQTTFISTLLSSYPVFLFLSISPVIAIFHTHLFLLSSLPFSNSRSSDFHLFYLSFLLFSLPFSAHLSCDFHLFFYPVSIFLETRAYQSL